MTYATSFLAIEMELLDESGKRLLKKTYSKKLDYKSGLYYRWNNLNYVGRNLCGIMNEFCSDAADVLETADLPNDEELGQKSKRQDPKPAGRTGGNSLLGALAKEASTD